MSDRLIVWYNTKCPVCDAGIDYQRNKLLALVRSGSVEFRDINLDPHALQAWGSDVEAVRKWLHATRGPELLKGADVAIALWRLTPGWGWLGTLLGNPLVLPLTRLGYNALAAVLYRWNKAKHHW